jgi:hypothetical protein
MSVTVAQVYSVRFGTKLPLPKLVQDNIAKLRIVAAAYKPVRYPPKHHHPKNNHKHDSTASENWRIRSIAGYVSRVKDDGDPNYGEIFAMLNKVAPSNLNTMVSEASEIIKTRDEEFRLRISTLIFNKAITDNAFVNVMADFAKGLHTTHPEIREDLILQANMFPTLYDVNTTLVHPSTSDPDYLDKSVLWAKQKAKRRGYAKFLTYLFVHDLVTEDMMVSSIENVLTELQMFAKLPKTDHTDENTGQYVDFIFESSKILPKTALELRNVIRQTLTELLAIPRPDVPSLGMRSRFRLDDALKCVQ